MQLDVVHKQVAKLKSQIHASKVKNDDLTKKHETNLREFIKCSDENKALKEKIEKMSFQLTGDTQKRENKEEEIRSLNLKLAELANFKAEKDKLTGSLYTLRTEREKAIEEKNKVKKKSELVEKEKNDLIEELEKTVEELKKRTSQAEKDKKKEVDKADELKKEAKIWTAKVDKLEKQVTELNAKIADLELIIEQKNSAVSELENEKKKLKSQLTTGGDKEKAAEKEKKELETKLEEMKTVEL